MRSQIIILAPIGSVHIHHRYLSIRTKNYNRIKSLSKPLLFHLPSSNLQRFQSTSTSIGDFMFLKWKSISIAAFIFILFLLTNSWWLANYRINFDCVGGRDNIFGLQKCNIYMLERWTKLYMYQRQMWTNMQI